MTSGKANVKKSVIDDIINLKRQEAKTFGLARQTVSGVGSVSVLGGSGMKGGSDSNENTSTGLNTAGGTMMGPIACFPKVTSIVGGVLDVGIDVNTVTPANAYSSRVICLGGATSGTSIDINTISNAAFAGQILYLQCVASTFLTLKHGTGNIFSPDGADVDFDNKEIITLQFDSTSGSVGGDWIVSSSFGSGGGGGSGLLASNNVWTGTNEFNGSFTSVSGTFSATGASTTIGDAGTDIFNLVAKMGTDINMSTYDINDVDRVKFSTTAGSGSALTSTDTGIEALYNAGVPYGMLVQFPSASSAVMQIKRGVTDMINISSLGILFGDELLMGGFKISNVLDPTAAQDAATKNYVDSNLLGSITNDLLPSPTDTWDLGSTTHRWVEAHVASVYFDTFGGRYLKNVGTDIELRTSNTRDIILSESNALGVSNPFMTLSGVGNNVQMDREVYMNSNKIVSLGTPTATADAATKGYVDGVVVAGANTSLSNLVSASVSINADLIPDITDARNIGGSSKYWGSAFISGRMYFDTGTNKFIDGTTTGVIELQVPSGGQVIFSEAGTDFYTMDGGSNTNTFSRDLWLTSGKAIRASSGVEIGYFVTNTTATVGSQGSVQIPTVNAGVTNAAAADAAFGSEIGCCGMFRISGGQALAVKITATTWQILQLGASGSTATPYII